MKAPVYIACIGSRETPEDMLPWLEETAAGIVRAGVHIVSGNAPGADQAWARGANAVDPARVTLCLPWESFEAHAVHPRNVIRTFHPKVNAREAAIAEANHTWWRGMPPGGQRLHARNVMILSGVRLMLGFRVAGAGGGTPVAFKIAKFMNVPAHDVGDPSVRKQIKTILGKALT